MGKDYSTSKKIMLIIGIPLLIIGIILIIYGFINFGSLFSSENLLEESDTGFGSIMYIAGGGFMLVFGMAMIYLSQFRRVTSYMATEASPAIETGSRALGKGLGAGLNSNQQREIIKIKCPHCGYLESEDADFCSKCGKKI